jgi:hypothetical protein
VTNAKLPVRRRNPELTAGRGSKSNRNHKRERSLTHHGYRFPSTQGEKLTRSTPNPEFSATGFDTGIGTQVTETYDAAT